MLYTLQNVPCSVLHLISTFGSMYLLPGDPKILENWGENRQWNEYVAPYSTRSFTEHIIINDQCSVYQSVFNKDMENFRRLTLSDEYVKYVQTTSDKTGQILHLDHNDKINESTKEDYCSS